MNYKYKFKPIHLQTYTNLNDKRQDWNVGVCILGELGQQLAAVEPQRYISRCWHELNTSRYNLQNNNQITCSISTTQFNLKYAFIGQGYLKLFSRFKKSK